MSIDLDFEKLFSCIENMFFLTPRKNYREIYVSENSNVYLNKFSFKLHQY